MLRTFCPCNPNAELNCVVCPLSRNVHRIYWLSGSCSSFQPKSREINPSLRNHYARKLRSSTTFNSIETAFAHTFPHFIICQIQSSRPHRFCLQNGRDKAEPREPKYGCTANLDSSANSTFTHTFARNPRIAGFVWLKLLIITCGRVVGAMNARCCVAPESKSSVIYVNAASGDANTSGQAADSN